MTTNTKSLQGIWDRESQKYVAREASLEAWPFERSLLPERDAKVLDAGCGAGTFLGMFRSLTEERFGVDISEKMVLAARRFGECEVGDVRNLSYADASFDYVFSCLVISHCEAPRQGLSELLRVCRENGRVILILPNRYSLNFLIRRVAIALGKYSLGESEHYTLGKMKRLGQELGFTVTHQSTWHRRPECMSRFRQLVGEIAYAYDGLVRLFSRRIGGDCLVVELKKGAQSQKVAGTFRE